MNVQGPFYVVDGCCTACDVPFVEAPGLFAYDDTHHGHPHCYVKRQPATEEELDNALRASWAAEFQCIRYRGTDSDTVRRLAEMGMAELCDSPVPAHLKPVFRNHVAFDTKDRTLSEWSAERLAREFQRSLEAKAKTNEWMSYHFKRIKQKSTFVSVSFAWLDAPFHEVQFSTINDPNARWLVRHSQTEKLGSRSVSYIVHDWLTVDGRFCSIRWYTEEQWNDKGHWQEMPS
jgi:hypothetical protein